MAINMAALVHPRLTRQACADAKRREKSCMARSRVNDLLGGVHDEYSMGSGSAQRMPWGMIPYVPFQRIRKAPPKRRRARHVLGIGSLKESYRLGDSQCEHHEHDKRDANAHCAAESA